MSTSLATSAFTSLGLQAITGLFQGQAIFSNLNSEDLILKDILTMELVVQVIEFIFYAYLVYMIISGHLSKFITSHRYVDWTITTPVMLVSFIMFFKYLKNPQRNIRLFESIKEEKVNIIKVIIANALMLLFGFLAERSMINSTLGIALGFIPFAYMFKIIYSDYAKDTEIAQLLYYVSFITWGLYGVAAALPFNQKNTMYNILDLFSKNAYGLFLYFFIKYKSVS
jgi:bacteriorhodopsin